MERRKMLACLTFLMVLILIGCTTRVIDFTLISTKNVDLSKAQNFTRGDKRVEGRDTAYIIIIIPTGVPHMKEAVDRAIEQVPGAVALVDGVIKTENFWFILFGQNSIIVEGLPLIDQSLIRKGDLPSNYMVSYFDKDKRQKLAYLTEEEYVQVKTALENGGSENIENILLSKN